MPVTRLQEGSIDRVKRAKGPDVWVYRYRQTVDGKRLHRSRVLGTVKQYKSKTEAKRASESLHAEINAVEGRAGKMTVEDAWGHFQANELEDPGSGRSPTTIQGYRDYFKNQILPHWRDVLVEDVKAVAVEKWLRSLDLADGTTARIRNHLSAIFSHLIRHELYHRLNPITSVRQGAGRKRDPDVLTLSEMVAILDRIEPQAIRVMVIVAATTALRRSEIRGLKWSDVGFRGEVTASAPRHRANGRDEVEDACVKKRRANAYGVVRGPYGLAERVPVSGGRPLRLRVSIHEGETSLLGGFCPAGSYPACGESGGNLQANWMAHIPAFARHVTRSARRRREDGPGASTPRDHPHHTRGVPAG
jgi:hypothetical protein